MGVFWKRYLNEGLPYGLFCGTAMIVVSISFMQNRMVEIRRDNLINKWKAVECQIQSSSASEERVFFEVEYSYEWDGVIYDSNQYAVDYRNRKRLLFFPTKDELMARYKSGTCSGA
jgi:hypothetical protein